MTTYKQSGWKRHEWDVVAQVPASVGGDILEVDYCSLCGKWRSHLYDGGYRVSTKRPDLAAECWL